jgi:hypothetical protein
MTGKSTGTVAARPADEMQWFDWALILGVVAALAIAIRLLCAMPLAYPAAAGVEQQIAILGHEREIHDALRQDHTVYRLREVDRARQKAVNFPQVRFSSVGESNAYRVEAAVCLPVQRSNQPEYSEFKKLPVLLVKLLHLADN